MSARACPPEKGSGLREGSQSARSLTHEGVPKPERVRVCVCGANVAASAVNEPGRLFLVGAVVFVHRPSGDSSFVLCCFPVSDLCSVFSFCSEGV